MKITPERLRKIIKEELEAVMSEEVTDKVYTAKALKFIDFQESGPAFYPIWDYVKVGTYRTEEAATEAAEKAWEKYKSEGEKYGLPTGTKAENPWKIEVLEIS